MSTQVLKCTLGLMKYMKVVMKFMRVGVILIGAQEHTPRHRSGICSTVSSSSCMSEDTTQGKEHIQPPPLLPVPQIKTNTKAKQKTTCPNPWGLTALLPAWRLGSVRLRQQGSCPQLVRSCSCRPRGITCPAAGWCRWRPLLTRIGAGCRRQQAAGMPACWHSPVPHLPPAVAVRINE